MRVILIDPYANKISEEIISSAAVLRRMMQHHPCDRITIAAPVRNHATGDTLRVNTTPDPLAPPWHFLGNLYRGRAVIVGYNLVEDAAVPLARVKKQVEFA